MSSEVSESATRVNHDDRVSSTASTREGNVAPYHSQSISSSGAASVRDGSSGPSAASSNNLQIAEEEEGFGPRSTAVLAPSEEATTSTLTTVEYEDDNSRINVPAFPNRSQLSALTSSTASQSFLMDVVRARSGHGDDFLQQFSKSSEPSPSETRRETLQEEAEELQLGQQNQLLSGMDNTSSKKNMDPVEDELELFQIKRAIAVLESTPNPANEDGKESSPIRGGEGECLVAEERNLEESPPEEELVGAFGVRSRGTEIYPAAGESRHPDSFTTSLPVAGTVVVDHHNSSEVVQQRIRDAEEFGRRTVLLEAAPAQVVTPQLLQLTKQNTQMPQFQPENEARFRREHDHLFLSALVVFRPLSIVCNLGFFVWDCIQPDPPLVKCFVTKVVSLVLFYLVTIACQKRPEHFSSLGLMAMLVISLQISVSLYLVDDGFVLGAGGYGVILIPACCGLRFYWAVASCVGTLLLANGLAVFKGIYQGEEGIPYAGSVNYEPYYVFIHLNMFIGVYCLFGLFISYVVELHLRQRFQANGTIFGWSDEPANNNNGNNNSTEEEANNNGMVSAPLPNQENAPNATIAEPCG